MATKKEKATRAGKYVPARVRIALTPGDSVRVARELQEMTQAELAAASGIPQPTLSSIEHGRAVLGAERAEKLARALKVHPAVLLWPNWDVEVESRRAAG
ncbi:MAG: helix-turn-helix transcriptional regulator [Myxococcales bacterium]|nr:helix-turn-helix transcriptional regulator [Myxococcales bacterium]